MFVKVLAINGSPRTKCNTATLLTNALVKEQLHREQRLNSFIFISSIFKGCISCSLPANWKTRELWQVCRKRWFDHRFSKSGGGWCHYLGSPIYLGTATGEMRSFMERLIFPYIGVWREHSTAFYEEDQDGFNCTLWVRKKTRWN